MSRPLDESAANRTGLVRVARIFSNVVSPPTLFATLGFALTFHFLPPSQAIWWWVAYGFLVSLAPILFVVFLLKTGRIAELHMSNTNERHLPYLSAIAGSAIYIGLVLAFDPHEFLLCLGAFNLVALSALFVINIVWGLISFHTTAAVATALLAGVVWGWTVGLLIVPLVILIIVVRLYLKRHTPIQVIAGAALGFIAVGSLTLFNCLA